MGVRLFAFQTSQCTPHVLEPVVAQLRKMGIRLIVYLDDMLIMAASRALAIEHTTIAVNLLSSLGFVLKEGKSVLAPTQELEFLGFLVNSVKNVFVPPKGQGKEYQEGVSVYDKLPPSPPLIVISSFFSFTGFDQQKDEDGGADRGLIWG